MEYEDYTVQEIYEHLFKNYGELGTMTEMKRTIEEFRSKPDLSRPPDRYFNRQTECQEIMENSRTPISDATIIEQMVTHYAKTGVITRSRQKWKRYLEINPSH